MMIPNNEQQVAGRELLLVISLKITHVLYHSAGYLHTYTVERKPFFNNRFPIRVRVKVKIKDKVRVRVKVKA